MLLILYLQRSIFLYRHQITSPHITIIQATDYLKASIVIEFAGIICSNKGTGIDISKVDDIDDASF